VNASLNRRDLLKGIAGGAAVAGLGSRPRAGEAISALVLCDHTDPSLLDGFTRATGIGVNIQEYEGTGTALSILARSRPGAWDVIALDSADLPTLVGEDLLAPLPEAALPWDDLFTELRPSGGNSHAVPAKFGYEAFAFDSGKVAAADMRTITTLWSGAYPGRIAIREDHASLIEMVGLGLGITPDGLDEAALAKIREKLTEIRKAAPMVGDCTAMENALVIGSADIVAGAGEIIVAGLMAQYANLDWTVPDEGAVRWEQCLGVLKASQRSAQAIQFLQYLLSPEGQGRLATSDCYWGVPASRKAALTRAQRKILRWDEQPGFLARSHRRVARDENLAGEVRALWAEFLRA
jgi:spermidine/putrescine transport system substrate-binding protein